MRGKFIQKKAQWYWYCGQNGAKMGVSEAPWGFLVFAHKHDPLPAGKKPKTKRRDGCEKSNKHSAGPAYGGCNAARHANGNLTITGNGTVDNVTHGKAALRIKENGKATLNGGYFNRSQEKGKGASESGENSFYTLINNGELIINNGAVVTTASEDSKLGRFSSLIENGFYSHGGSTYYPTLTINGGTFKGGLNTIKNDDNGITNIYGGKCENYYQACVQNHHKTTIYNGEFSADVSSAWSVLNCGSCSSVDPTHDAHELVIKNGNFKGDVRANVGSVKIEGGNFESSFTKEGNATIEISGGTFKKGVDKSYIVDGKKLDANGNVVPDTITIIVPSEGGNTTTTPSTDNTKNPGTGANDLVGVAAAMAVVSLLGAAAVIRKK